MATNRNAYGIQFQRGVLKAMLDDIRFCDRAVQHVKKEFFAPEIRWFFEVIAHQYKTLSRPPTRHMIEAEITHHGTDTQKFLDEFKLIQEADFNIEYLKREMTGYIRNNIFYATVQESAQLFNQGSYLDAFTETQDKIDYLLRVDFTKENGTGFGDHELVMQEAAEQRKNAIPTGIHAIDEAMGGGLFPQTWTTFLGASNVGKSFLMPNLAFAAANVGKRTFVTIHEDEEIPTKLRYLSRFSGVELNRLYLPKVSLEAWEKEAIETADQVLKEYVKLRFMYTTESTIEAVQQAARNLMKEWEYHLFLCDYGQCLKSNSFRKGDSEASQIEQIYHDLKQLCCELRVAGAGPAQVTRAGHAMSKTGSELLRCTDVGLSWGIIKKSSNAVTMNRSDKDVANKKIVYLLDKVRQGVCPIVVECTTDYARAELIPIGNGMQSVLSLNLTKVNPDQPTPEYLRQAEGRDTTPAVVSG